MKIVIAAENRGASPLELLGKARQMAPDAGITARGEGAEFPSDAYRAAGADEVILIPSGLDDCAQGSRMAEAIRRLAPDSVLFPATVRGRFLSAWVAARLKTGLTADCTQLELTEEGLLKQIRPAFGGSITARILCRERRPQMASVRPGVFPPPEGTSPRPGFRTHEMDLPDVRSMMEKIAFQPTENDLSLQSAPVVVAGGKGIGGKKGFEKLFELARLLGGAVGASRSAVDAGYVPYAHQIGQTGVTVRPRLYLAFGISGAVQHTVGMSGAGTVVAVNLDRNAPIFSSADYGIIADWEETVGALIQYLNERKNAT